MTRPPFGKGEDIVLHRRVPKVIDGVPQYDEYGGVIYVDVSETVTGAAIWPESASEVLQSVDRTNTVYIVLVPITVAIDAVDAVTWDGRKYEVQGETERFKSPFTDSALQTFRMSRVEG